MAELYNQVRQALMNVPASYDFFYDGFADDLKGHEEAQKKLLAYLKEHPDARADRVMVEIIENIAPELYAENDDDDYDEDEDE